MLNARLTLRPCLQALRSQDLQSGPYEVLVVDNGSSDGSDIVCADFPEVTLLHCATPGSYASRNMGLARARGEAIAFVDSDCVPVHGWLSAYRQCLQSCDLAMGPRTFGGSSPSLQLLQVYENTKIETVLKSGVVENYYGYTNNMAVRRNLLDTVGGFREVMRGADTILVQQVAHAYGPNRVGYCPTAWVEHLELDRPRAYFGKKWLYGQSNTLHELRWPEYTCRPLDRPQRLAIYRQTCSQLSLDVWGRTRLLALLGLGLFAYEAGRWAGRLRR